MPLFYGGGGAQRFIEKPGGYFLVDGVQIRTSLPSTGHRFTVPPQ